MKVSTDSGRKIDEIASEWLVRRDSEAWSDADQRGFDAWLNESPLHRVAFLRIEHVWERASRLEALGAGARRGEVPPAGQWNFSPFANAADIERHCDRRGIVHSGRVRAIAASFLLAAALGLAWSVWPVGPAYRTPVGGLAVVPMADGSTITLNTDSRIRVAMSEKERRVELERGEAFFDVAKDPGRPFVVDAGDQRVIAVGTQFSVRREGNEIRVVVTEGRVRVEPEGREPVASREPLSAGAVALANDAGVLLQQQALPEAQEALSWRTGMLVFRDLTLTEAVAEFNRYNTRKIIIEDPGIATLRIAGSFRATNLDAFARLLERGYPLHAQYADDRIILRGTQLPP